MFQTRRSTYHRPSLSRASARVHAPVVVLAVALALAGCGGSSKTSSSTSATVAKPVLTKAEFLAQGNAICAEGNRKLAAAQKTLEQAVGNAAPTRAQISAFVNGVFVPAIQAQIDKLRALGAPAGEKAAVAHALNLAQADIDAVKAKPQTLVSGHPFANFAHLVHAYGLRSCARNA